MRQPFELAIGLRYTRSKRRNRFVSFISLISVVGIALGITTLITVLSVMNGFQTEVRERILGMASHATVTKRDEPILEWQKLADAARAHPEVLGAAPYVEAQVMLVNGGQVTGSVVRGVIPDEEPAVSDIVDQMVEGSLNELDAARFNIVLGRALARFLGVRVGDKVTVVSPEAGVTPAGITPRLKRFTVVGIFATGMSEYDRSMAITSARDAAALMRMKGYTGVRLKLDDMFKSREVASDLAGSLDDIYWVSDWTQQHRNFFRAVQTEKTMMFIILSLIVAVAAFNIVSMLIMVVNEKQADIAILRTLGASPGSVMKIFLVQGTLIGLFGTLLGVIGGVSIASNVESIVPFIESLFGTKFLDPSVYAINYFPSDLQLADVLWVTVIAFFLSVFATLYPAWRAAQTDPVEALRYD